MERRMKAAYAERRAPEALIRSVILKVGAARKMHREMQKETTALPKEQKGTEPAEKQEPGL